MGYTEAPRGALAHWIVIEDGKIANYQAIVPSTWNAGPRDAQGQPGAYEAALEEFPEIMAMDETDQVLAMQEGFVKFGFGQTPDLGVLHGALVPLDGFLADAGVHPVVGRLGCNERPFRLYRRS